MTKWDFPLRKEGMAPRNSGIAGRFLLTVAGTVRRLPNFRGKVRALMALHRILGLENSHVVVSTALHHPTSFRVRLDLFCKHERMAFFMDRYEPGTVEFLARLCPDDRPFIDIGANIGLIAIPFTIAKRASFKAHTGRDSDQPLTYCIEAIESNSEALKANICLNDLGNRMQVVLSAVGEREKDVDIQMEKNQKRGAGTGTANILAEHSTYDCERIRLHVTTVDHLVAAQQLPRDCGLIKVDTDGYDLFALMGAHELIQQARPVIYGELMAHCLNWHGQTIHDVQAYLDPLEYRVYIRSDEWRFTGLQRHSRFVQDALCVPSEQASGLSWCIS